MEANFSSVIFNQENVNMTQWVVLPGVLSVSVSKVLVILIARVLLPLTEIFGIVTNFINLIVFWSMGLNDSVTSSFFALSLTDFCYLVASLIGWMSSLLGVFGFQNWINLEDLSYISVWYSLMFLAMSVFLTTYIAVQRCCCVVLPMKFKGVFTTKRNVAVIVFLCVLSAALHIPILSKMGLKTYVNPVTNSSKVAIWYADDWGSLLTIKDFLVGLWLPLTTQVITVICMFILIAGLRKSLKFRQSAIMAPKGQSSDDKDKISSKEIQVVKAVTVVTLVSIICNIAPICQALARIAENQFALYKRYTRIFFVVVVSKHAFQHINSSLNMFIYLRFNSTYRNTLKKFFYRITSREKVDF